MNRDPYEVLGVSRSATDDEIKIAYRTLAKKFHPDLNGGSAQAETKMKEVNEAYTILIKNKGQGYGQSYGSNSSSGSYGNAGGYGGYGGYGSNGGYQGSSNTGGSSQGGYSDYDPFGFGDFFRRAQQQQARGSGATTYTEFDPLLKNVEDAVLDGNFARAQQMLVTLRDRRAAWYYWSARVNVGLGNRVAALNDARMAVQMAPDEVAYRELLAGLQASGQTYQQQGSQRGFVGSICANPCMSLIIANVLCNCCCTGGRSSAYCC